MNKIFLMGNITKDPELKQAGTTAVTNNSIAVKRDGKESLTDFFNFKAFGKTAETFCQFMTKGSQILLEGRVQNETWKDKDGNKKEAFVVIADKITFIGKKEQSKTNNEDISGVEFHTPDSKNYTTEVEVSEDDLPWL